MIEVQGRRVVHAGRSIGIAELDVLVDGKPKVFEEAFRPPGVRLVIWHPETGDLLMTEEHRFEQGAGSVDLRLPGGKVFNSLEPFLPYYEAGEEVPEERLFAAAALEAEQEAATKVSDLRVVSRAVCGAQVVWDLYYIEGTKGADVVQDLEEGEVIEPVWVPPAQVVEALRTGRINEDRTAAFLWHRLAADGHA